MSPGERPAPAPGATPPRAGAHLARWEGLLLLGIALASAALMLRPVFDAPLGLAIGAQNSEAPRHFWGLWATLKGLGEWGPFVAHLDVGFPGSYTRHLMDPINLVFFGPGYAAGGGGLRGAVVGWNLLHAAWPAVGALGGWWMAREWVGRDDDALLPRLLAALACGTAPALLATPWLGRTEYLPAALWPAHLVLLRRALLPQARAWTRVGAGATLGAIALGGWYLAAWLALLEPPLALALAARAPGSWRQRLGRLALVGGVALLAVLPALWALWAYPPPVLEEGGRSGAHLGVCTPPWLLLPFTGSHGLPGTDLAAYPGTVLFLLAALGAAVDRRARPWFGLALGLLVLSLGPYLIWTPTEGGLGDGTLPLPALALQTLLPPLQFIWGWNRIAALLTPPLALAAALGLRAVLPRLQAVAPQVATILLVGMVVDHAQVRAPAGITGSSFPPALPPTVAQAMDALPEGAILQLPFDDFYMTWQPLHGRPIAESLELEPVREDSWLVRQVERATFETPSEAPIPPDLQTEGALGCLRAAAGALGEQGFVALLLHREMVPDRHLDLASWLAEGLGTPVYDGPDLVAWTLPEAAVPPPRGYDCSVPPLAARPGGRPLPPGSPR